VKDPYTMTEAEVDALWAWAATKAEMRTATQAVSAATTALRQATVAAEYRRRHPEVAPETRDVIVRLLAEMESSKKRRA
jgi:hypothetical protein